MSAEYYSGWSEASCSSPSLGSPHSPLAVMSDARRDRGRHAADARAVSRVQGRRRQQAGPLGQDRRVHEARRGQLGPRALPRAGQDQRRQPVHRARNQLARHAEEPRPLQADGAQALLPGRRADATPSATRSSGRASSCCSSPAASTRPRSARRRCRSSSCTSSRPSDAPDVKKILDNVIFLLVPSLNPDGQIMVTDWFNKNLGTPIRRQPDCRISITRTSATTTTATCTCSRRRRASTWRSCCGTTGSPSVWLDEHQMGSNGRAHLRDAGDRPDQPQRAPADLPLERHPRPVAGGGARGGRQGRHHLQLHVHQLLGRARWRGAAGGTTRSAC